MDLEARIETLRQTHHQPLVELQSGLDASLAEAGEPLRSTWRALSRAITHHLRRQERDIHPALLASPTPGLRREACATTMEELDILRQRADAVRQAPLPEPEDRQALDQLLGALAASREAEEALAHELSEDPAPEGATLRTTTATCPTCLRPVEARVRVEEGAVVLQRTCPEHGLSQQLVSRHPAWWADLDCYYFEVNGQTWPQRDYVVHLPGSCGPHCSMCTSRAHRGDLPELDLAHLEQEVAGRRGVKVDLMAGPETPAETLVDWVKAVKRSGNMVAVHLPAAAPLQDGLARSLAEAGLDEITLQLTHLDAEVRAALQALSAQDLATTLLLLLDPDDRDTPARVLELALQPTSEHIRELLFQGVRTPEHTPMPDQALDRVIELCPTIHREDVRRFSKVYFGLLSALKVRKCLYVHHYLLARDGQGGCRPVSELVDLPGMAMEAERYAKRLPHHKRSSRLRYLAGLARHGATRQAFQLMVDSLQLQRLLQRGAPAKRSPRRFLVLGFTTACDARAFDLNVAERCGKGELDQEHGFVDSVAMANVGLGPVTES